MSKDTFKAKGDSVELVEGFPYRAQVRWHARDVETFAEDRGLDWSLKDCDDFLFGYAKYIQERLCEVGHELIDFYLDDFMSDQEDETT